MKLKKIFILAATMALMSCQVCFAHLTPESAGAIRYTNKHSGFSTLIPKLYNITESTEQHISAESTDAGAVLDIQVYEAFSEKNKLPQSLEECNKEQLAFMKHRTQLELGQICDDYNIGIQANPKLTTIQGKKAYTISRYLFDRSRAVYVAVFLEKGDWQRITVVARNRGEDYGGPLEEALAPVRDSVSFK